MAKVRRVVRKVQPPVRGGMDDQLWPVIVALFVLCGLLMGIAAAYLPFGGPRWWWDARTWLFAIPIATCLIVWALRHVDRKMMRRTLQAAIVICLIVHVVMLVVSRESYIFGPLFDQRSAARRPTPQRRIVVADYQSFQLESEQRQRQEYVQPVQTEIPEPELDPPTPEPDRQETQPVEPSRSLPVPPQEMSEQRSIADRQATQSTVPRLGEQLSQLSRQEVSRPAEASSSAAVPAAAAATATATAAATTESNPTAVARQSTASEPTTSAAAAAAQPSTEQASVARATQGQATPRAESPRRATMPRAVAEANSVPRTDVTTGEVAGAARQTENPTATAQRTAVRQQVTAAPTAEPAARAQPNEPVAVTAESVPRREQAMETQPQLAQTPVPVPATRPRATPRPAPVTTATDVAANPRSMPATSEAAPIQPTETAVSRADSPQPATSTSPQSLASDIATRSTASPSPTSAPSARAAATPATPTNASNAAVATMERSSRSNQLSTNSNAQANTPTSTAAGSAGAAGLTSGDTSLARQTPLEANSSGQRATEAPLAASSTTANAQRVENSESVANANRAPSTVIARAASDSAVATSRTTAETPASSLAEAGADRPQANPSRMAVTKSLNGVAGVGQSANLDRSPSAPSSPSLMASGAARREQATQTEPAGPALAPSDVAPVRRSIAGPTAPGAPLVASTAGVAETAGDQQPAELASSASASLSRNASNAAIGAVTADKGNTDIDLGPTRVADAGGFDRASGGGQPEVNFDSDSQQLARDRTGGSAALTSSVAELAATMSAPPSASAPGELSAAVTEIGPTVASATPTTTGTAGSNAADAADGNQGDVAAPRLARNDSRADRPALGEAGTGLSAAEEEEERRRRLGRSTAEFAPAGSAVAATDAAAPGSASSRAANPNPADGSVAASSTAVSREAATGAAALGAANAAASAPLTGGTGAELAADAITRRAEPVDAVMGPPVIGGGTDAPQRSAVAQELSTNRAAPIASLEGGEESTGKPRGSELAAQGVQLVDTSTGLQGRPTADRAGGAADPVLHSGPPEGALEMAGGTRASLAGGPSRPGESGRAGPGLARAESGGVTAPVGATAGPAVVPGTSVAQLEGSGESADETPMDRRESGSVPVAVRAPAGPGGLDLQLSLNVGINTRPAQQDSMEIQTTPSRFLRQDVGGTPELSTAAIFSAEAFRRREARSTGKPEGRARGSAGPQTEEAIELGLAWLARQQLPDGSWTLQSPGEEVALASDTAATGLALLAFQGAGYNHHDYKYAPQIAAAITFLLKNQKPDGDLFVPMDDVSNRSVWLYSHGIASIALCEAYGMTHDPTLADPAQRAIDFVSATQDKQGGGWRYAPGLESDTSVTGWMMMALKSGELAGLKVRRETYDGIRRWLDRSQANSRQPYLYRYNPYAPDTEAQRHGRSASTTMTAVGLLMRLYGGWRRDHAAMIQGADYLAQNLPAVGSIQYPQRDTYYWYYATQVMYHMGGEHWSAWNSQLHPLLIQSQVKQGGLAGSWSPRTPVPDRWAPHGGRLYVTAMNLLSLEVAYRHLPLYIDTAR